MEGKCNEVKNDSGNEPGSPGDGSHHFTVRNVSDFASELGCRVPVFVTKAVWEACIRTPDDCPLEEPDFRLWKLLIAFADAGEGMKGGSKVPFSLSLSGEADGSKSVRLVADGSYCFGCSDDCGGFSDGPAVVLMLESEA